MASQPPEWVRKRLKKKKKDKKKKKKTRDKEDLGSGKN